MDDDANVSIGQQSQARDQRMLDELAKRQDQARGPGSDPFVPPEADAPAADEDGPRKLVAEDDDEWHPGEADQPDRTGSEGLSGLGPAQPE